MAFREAEERKEPLQVEEQLAQRLKRGNWKPGSVTGGQPGKKKIEGCDLEGVSG